MKLYRTPGAKWSGTLADHKADMKAEGLDHRIVHEMNVPTDKPSLIAWLNKEDQSRASAQSLHADGTVARAGQELPVRGRTPSHPPASYAEQSVAFEDQWESFPLALKAHYASLAWEDMRDMIPTAGAAQ